MKVELRSDAFWTYQVYNLPPLKQTTAIEE